MRLEQSLGVVAEAMKREFQPHFSKIGGAGLRLHSFIVPAFLNSEPRVYTIDMVDSEQGYKFRYTRHVIGGALTPLQITPPICVGGSGTPALLAIRDWRRPLLRMVKAYDCKRVSSVAVCERLADLSFRVHENTTDGTVGPSCIVVWRNSKISVHKGGGGHANYSARTRENSHPAVPTITNGMDLAALVSVMWKEVMPAMQEWHDAVKEDKDAKPFEPDTDRLNARLQELPSEPDEKLR